MMVNFSVMLIKNGYTNDNNRLNRFKLLYPDFPLIIKW